MNFAFPALLIFLLALPGILLRMGYRKGVNGAWKNPFVIQSLGDEIAWSSIFAGVLHILWVRGWNHFKGPVDFASAMSLLVATNGDLVKDAIEKTSRSAGDVALYFSTLVVFAYSLGVGAHWLVRSRGLDQAKMAQGRAKGFPQAALVGRRQRMALHQAFRPAASKASI